MRRIVFGCLAILASGCAAAGCGGSSSNGVASKSPSQILQTAIAAMKSAKSVHMAGTIIQAAKTIKVDMTIYSNGDVNGNFNENGPTVSIIKIGPTDYIKTTSGFYQSQGSSAKIAGLMGGKWIEIPDSSVGLGSSFSLLGLANSITQNHKTVSAGNGHRLSRRGDQGQLRDDHVHPVGSGEDPDCSGGSANPGKLRLTPWCC